MRILLVDDDAALMESLAERLIQQRYAVDIAVDGSSAQSYVDLFNYDLVVLDLMLPDGDGIQFCQQFRQGGYTNPLMMLTAKERTAEKVRALDAGADDYVVKPFDFDELCARIRALLRRDAQGLPPVLQWGPLTLDPSTCETSFQEQPIRLTPKEFSMMELFLRHPHRVYSLGAIIDDLWSFEDSPGEDAVRTHIKGLRRKLQAAGAPKDLIKTVYGLGYRLNQEVAWTGQDDSVLAAQGKGDASAQLISQAIAQSCKRYLGSASQKIAVLEAAARSLSSGTLDPELHYASQINAHQLAGSLGCFGLAEGSQIARQIETQLRAIALPSTQPEPAIASDQPSKWAVPLPESIAHLVKALRESVDQAAAQAADTHAVSALRSAGMSLLLIVSDDENLTGQLVQAAAVAQLQTQVVATLEQAEHLLGPVNRPSQVAEASYWSDSILYTPVSSLAMCAAAAVSDQTSVSNRRSPDLLLLDIPTDATPFSALLQQARQDAIPVVVLERGLTLATRLKLLEQGVALVSDRSAPPPQIMESAASLLKANRPIRIAIADGDPQILALLKISLELWGFQVQTFENALDLWQWLTSDESPDDCPDAPPGAPQTTAPAEPKVDILLLDIKMPKIDGLGVCRVLRADTRFRSLPIVFTAAHQEDGLRIQAFQAGANDFIDKAVAPTELVTRLHNQLSSDCRPVPVELATCQLTARNLAQLN